MIFPTDEEPALPLIQAKKRSTNQRRKKRCRRRRSCVGVRRLGRLRRDHLDAP